MKFSIVIPNLNSTIIPQTLNSLEKQNYAKDQYEVIVVGLDEQALVQISPLVKFDRTERKYSPAEARNRGARQSRGEIIVFLNSDCVTHSNWLIILERDFNNPDIAGIGGAVRFDMTNYWNVADNFSLFHEFLKSHQPGLREQLPSLNFALRKNIFSKFGGFDENYPLPAGEDFDLTLRISKGGYSLLFDPEAWIMHLPARNSLKTLLRHSFTIGLYSTKIDMRYQKEIGLPSWLLNRTAILISSPILAMGATLNTYWRTPNSVQFIFSLPVVYLAKIAWCFGAAYSPRLSGKF